MNKLKEYGLTPKEQLTLEPYERDHAMILGTYRWFHWFEYIFYTIDVKYNHKIFMGISSSMDTDGISYWK